MRGILYKEFVLFKPAMALYFVTLLFTCGAGVNIAGIAADRSEQLPELICGLPCFLSYFYTNLLNSEIFRRDERRSWIGFAASTPETLRGQMSGKYWFILILNLIPEFLWFITTMIVLGVTNGGINLAQTSFIVFCFFMIMNAVEIPFIVRFGANKGVGIKTITFGAVLFLLIIYALFGDISFLFGDNPLQELWNMLNGSAMIWTFALTPYVAVILYYLSYRLSLKLYMKGAENYEQ